MPATTTRPADTTPHLRLHTESQALVDLSAGLHAVSAWTAAQWDALPHDRRPEGAKRIGECWVLIAPF